MHGKGNSLFTCDGDSRRGDLKAERSSINIVTGRLIAKITVRWGKVGGLKGQIQSKSDFLHHRCSNCDNKPEAIRPQMLYNQLKSKSDSL